MHEIEKKQIHKWGKIQMKINRIIDINKKSYFYKANS